jgi:hypothetical protein
VIDERSAADRSSLAAERGPVSMAVGATLAELPSAIT